MTYIKPKVLANLFTCPYCNAIAKQNWWLRNFENTFNININRSDHPIRVGKCDNCLQSTVWINDVLYYPDTSNAPPPNADMPPDVLKLYLEASAISSKSPRGAAALLRLSIQILCVDLGEEGKNINTDIKSLVAKGLPPIVQQSLDIVRVTGNDAVHPGQIAVDDPETVGQLFELLNIIVQYMIAMPNQVNSIYSSLPADKRDGIEQRDKK